MNRVRYNLFKAAVDKWGIPSQLDMMVEECSELITAIQHYKRGRVVPSDMDAITHEAADVYIMVQQLAEIVGRDKFEAVVSERFEHLTDLIEGAGK
ncbi:antitoxin [Candidatus Pacearchaeota archaeon]|nr:antitoxin [Candidatus Pacearchaeota archaeon]